MKESINNRNKHLVWEFWKALDRTKPSEVLPLVMANMSSNVVWHGPDPINNLTGADAFCEKFWIPLKASFSDLKRHAHIFMGGQSHGRIDGNMELDGKMWVSGTGYLTGIFRHDYLTIPANHKEVHIRWGEFCNITGGKITEVYFLLDLIDLMQQAGCHVLPPGKGKDDLYPPPIHNDGILLASQDKKQTAYSMEHIRRFIFEGLNRYDQANLKSMGMSDFFHKDVKWYGPGGIGACLSFKEFESLHQQPWLIAFPDRHVENLNALIAEGMYSGGSGWAGVKATHTGSYLGCPATNKRVEINGLDWWKREGEEYVENWVFVDMIHVFRQMDIDLFKRIKNRE